MRTFNQGLGQKKTKYKNVRIKTVHGWFDSQGELSRWLFLLDAARRGLIYGLERQIEYGLDVNGRHVCAYVADFVYRFKDARGREHTVVEDFKGMLTDVFRLKAKLFRAVYGYDIRVVKNPTEDPCEVVNPGID